MKLGSAWFIGRSPSSLRSAISKVDGLSPRRIETIRFEQWLNMKLSRTNMMLYEELSVILIEIFRVLLIGRQCGIGQH